MILVAAPSAAIAQNGTISFPYPNGKTAADFVPGTSKLHVEAIGALLAEANDSFDVALGASTVVVTYKHATPVPAATRVRLDLVLREEDALLTTNVEAFGAVGDDSTVNTTAIQAAIARAAAASGEVFFPAGTYISGQLLVPSNVTLRGVPGRSILKASAAITTSEVLLRNETLSGYANSNISIRDLIIDGNDLGAGVSQTRMAELVTFARATKVRLKGVVVRNHEYIGVAIAGCHDVKIDDCEFTDCGYDGTTTNGGSALWVANRVSDSSEDVTVTNCYFHDLRWHGAHFSAIDGTIRDCRFQDVQEAAVFTPIANAGKRSFINNKIDGVTIRDISASGIEVGGNNVVIMGNQISGTEGSAVALTDAQDVVVTGNTFTACEKMGVHVICSETAPDQPQDITITSNRMTDDGAGSLCAVKFTSAGDAATGVTIEANDLRGTWADGAAIVTNPKIGADSRIAGNAGYNPIGVSAITVGSSPYTYTAGLSPETVYILGGTVSSIAIGAGSTVIFTSTDRTIELGPLDRVIVTYSGTPTMVRSVR